MLMKMSAFISSVVVISALSGMFYAGALEVENIIPTAVLTDGAFTENLSSTSSTSTALAEKVEKVESKVEKKVEKDFFREVLAFFGFSFIQPSGVSGEVTAYDSSYITLLDKKDNEQYIIVASTTRILLSKATTTINISTSTIGVGDTILVLGKANKLSFIEAKLIKILTKKEIVKEILKEKEPSPEKETKVAKPVKIEKIKTEKAKSK